MDTKKIHSEKDNIIETYTDDITRLVSKATLEYFNELNGDGELAHIESKPDGAMTIEDFQVAISLLTIEMHDVVSSAIQHGYNQHVVRRMLSRDGR